MEIRKEIIRMYIDGNDMGYKNNSDWWYRQSDPDAFRIATLDEDYPPEYFKEDHVSNEVVKNYCNSIIREFELFTGRKLKSIVEFGSGGGWFTEEFRNRAYHIIGLEGTKEGLKKCDERGIGRLRLVDFREPLISWIGKYDIALCTEVAEHIEPPFSSTLINSLISYSDIIWWSSAEPNVGRPHLHHPNEQPYQYWINLFKFYGYEAIRLSDEIYNACEYRGRYMFYNEYKFPQK